MEPSNQPSMGNVGDATHGLLGRISGIETEGGAWSSPTCASPTSADLLLRLMIEPCLSFAEKTVKRRIALRLLFATTIAHDERWNTSHNWVTRETKERFAAVARHQGLSDSALLKRLVDLMLQSASAAEVGTPRGADRTSRDSRLTVRIRPDDQLLLRERAAARGMAAATYVSVLTRSHLRSLAPLPKAVWLILERFLTELGKLGRNINQIAREISNFSVPSSFEPGGRRFESVRAHQ
jgi:hypothetical protein